MPVLYRTHRPKSFKEVIGQDHIVSALEGAIKNKKISHAYLFSGPRGTGKTSIARIVAREIGTKDEDIYEFDAASNRGIDDIREIREHVNVRPFSSPYKVYIVDEVHMLTKEAFNALLKTLEEPPTHAVFILATTELHKVPDTIVSRCQTFYFKKPSRDILAKMITSVAKKEGKTLEKGVADIIALLGDGSFRDTLGILEKVISMSADDIISLEEISSIVGAPKSALVNSFIDKLVSKDADGALSVIAEVEQSGMSISVFATLVLEKSRFVMLAQNSPASRKGIEDKLSPDDWQFVSSQLSASVLAKMTPEILGLLLVAVESMPRAHIESLPLELAVVEACAR